MTDDKREAAEKRRKYLEQRHDDLCEGRWQMEGDLDKYLFLCATGGLYLSVLVVNEVKDPVCKELLCWGWAFLVLSIINGILSFFISMKAHDREIEIANCKLKATKNDNIVVCCSNCWTVLVGCMSVLSAFLFIAGTVLLTYFYFKNI